MTQTIALLQHRSLIEISGADRLNFIQGLITNDINKLQKSPLIYSAMLNAQGRFLYDFFLFEHQESLFLDCYDARRDEIIRKLNLYKLRAKIEIKKNDNLKIFQYFTINLDHNPTEKLAATILQFLDPRCQELGYRLYATPADIAALSTSQSSIDDYHFKRITLKIPEGELDLAYEKSFVLEFDFNRLNAIDYQKGCYVGQELTTRTHHRGEIRKKLYHLELPRDSAVKNGCKIILQENVIGEILSSVLHNDKLHSLALIKSSEDYGNLTEATNLLKFEAA